MIEQSVIPGKQANLKEGKERGYKTSRFFSFYTQNREWIDFVIFEGFNPMNKDVFPQLFTAGWQPLDTAARARAQNGAAGTEWWVRITDENRTDRAWREVSTKIAQDSSSRVTAQRFNLWACSPL